MTSYKLVRNRFGIFGNLEIFDKEEIIKSLTEEEIIEMMYSLCDKMDEVFTWVNDFYGSNNRISTHDLGCYDRIDAIAIFIRRLSTYCSKIPSDITQFLNSYLLKYMLH